MSAETTKITTDDETQTLTESPMPTEALPRTTRPGLLEELGPPPAGAVVGDGAAPPSAEPTTPTAAARRQGPSVPTIIWGLLLALVAAGAVTHQVSDVSVDYGVVTPLVLLGAGAALVVWGVAGLGRRRG